MHMRRPIRLLVVPAFVVLAAACFRDGNTPQTPPTVHEDPVLTTTAPATTNIMSTTAPAEWVVPQDLDSPIVEWAGRATAETPPPEFATAVSGDDGSAPLPLGSVTDPPDNVRLDFLFEFCFDTCFRDAHFLQPSNPSRGSGPYTSGVPFHVRHGFPNDGNASLGEGFGVTLFVSPIDTGPNPPVFGFTPDYVLRGESEACGPTYRIQIESVQCEWFVHEFPDGLPEGRHALWAVWEAPCWAWLEYGFTEECANPDEVISLFSSGVDSPFTSDPPNYSETRAGDGDIHAEPDRMIRKVVVPSPEPTSDGASGSGCAANADSLPDGVWFGFITDLSAHEIELDLACWYMGEAAHEKATAAGEVPLAFWIANDDSGRGTISVASDAIVWQIYGDVSQGLHEGIPFVSWNPNHMSYASCPGDGCPFWITVHDGIAMELSEQYIP